MNVKILYEDNHLIAVYKPAGILVQAGDRKSPNLLDEVRKYLKEKYKKPGNVFVGLVHRLDKSVSGIVVFAKTSKGASRLSEQFRNRKVVKVYYALVEGRLEGAGSLVHFIKKDKEELIAKISEEEKEEYQRSELSYKSMRHTASYTLLSIFLKKGRFNQIRAQFAHIGHPIAGDTLYGAKKRMPDGSIGLCANEITFKTATGDEIKTIKIDYPKEWVMYLSG